MEQMPAVYDPLGYEDPIPTLLNYTRRQEAASINVSFGVADLIQTYQEEQPIRNSSIQVDVVLHGNIDMINDSNLLRDLRTTELEEGPSINKDLNQKLFGHF